nr:LL-diaminopimelate aminotransferase [uncultured Flavonifractor sp.]
MTRINENFRKLPGCYLFSEVARRVAACRGKGPDRPLLRLGIGDVPGPLPAAVTAAMGRAVEEMGTVRGFRGYGPEQGYPFLREAIARWDYESRGVDIRPEEIFVSDGAKSDCGSIGELFGGDNVVAVCDPVYPVYVDASAMAGRAGDYDAAAGRWTGLVYLPCVAENGFVPELPEGRADLIYLCFPNNPTGAAATRAQLKVWVDYANRTGAVILFDSAYEAFISDPELPRSIFEIEGARTCAIEFRSFSKTAGFTGTRCAYTVIPRELERGGLSLNRLWGRRRSAKCNGVAYVVQRGAQAVYSPEGRAQVAESLAGYRRSAGVLRKGLDAAGLTVYGGEHAPYLWVRTPGGMGSWAFFDLLLERAGVVVTPGAGFGPSGEGYVRLSAFCAPETAAQAAERIGESL